ncbi:MAG: DMT family transporter, partial [Spirochaetales bacterium]|nr:DMT family transporter [Spirochaetales bacterium]
MSPLVFALVLTAACAHALWNFFSKKVSGNFTVFWYGLVLSNAVLFVYTLYCFFTEGFDARGLLPAAVSAAAHAGYFTALCYNYSQRTDISTVYPIARGTGVMGTALLSYAIFAEHIPPFAALGIAAVCAGIILMAASGLAHARINLKPCLVALLTGLCTVAYSLADKQGVRYINPLAYNNILTLAAILPLAPLAHPKGRAEAGKLLRSYFKETLIIGFGCTGTYILILWAMRFERASYVVSLREFSVVIASL